MFTKIGGAGDSAVGWDHMNGWGGAWMWMWGMVMIALFALLIVWLIRSTGGEAETTRSPQRSPTDRALEILAERYARGELSTDEYRERADELR